MPVIISCGSGKGGTGKSMVITNLAFLLARRGKTVCLTDLDVGGADAHIMLGQFNPAVTLTDFLTRKVSTLENVMLRVPPLKNLSLIAGTGETLKTSNMPYATKQRLIRDVKKLPVDIVLIDVGAGTHFHALDFFMLGDYQLCVTTPDPTATLDLYRFIKLATIRKVLSSFVSYEAISGILARNDFKNIKDIFEEAEKTGDRNHQKAKRALKDFHPMLVINKTRKKGSGITFRLEQLLKEYLHVKLEKLGTIPVDVTVEESVRSFMPVCEAAPNSPAAKALHRITDNLLKYISQAG